MPYKDPEKQKEYLRNYHKSYHQKRYQSISKKMIEYLGGKCEVCKTQEDLEFDHIDPSSKKYAIKSIWNRSWAIIEDELKKCQLLCKSCHLKKTRSDRANG